MEGIRSVERAVAVVQVVADRGADGARLVDIVAATGLQKTTAHRLLGTLVQLGWLEQDTATGAFHLGLALVALGTAASTRHGLLELANPHLLRLAELTADTVYLSVRIGAQAVCVDRVTGEFPIRTLTLRPGDRRPLGTGAGSLALLAWLPDEEAERLVERSAGPGPLGDPAVLHQLIGEARAQGYALNAGMIVPGASGVGVPVRGDDGRPVAALSVAAIDSRLAEPRRAQVVRWLVREATELERTLSELAPHVGEADVRRLLPAIS
ncbi:IclR family transcriptional regulator [Pseudonocardia humida]|uniref:IclR family transcriptional regulator n=1 Tax=Pseudonocardia humida TaxID=2800819 RepID=A0ABT1A667_9PSEU|nr:IclR family transcriptional regulator [Pseudonocardia humida]MCO1658512.1 IclR family transcriptional regulator [Pseudonocardia humida]